MNKLMRQAMQLQADMEQRRAELQARSFAGSAGGGVVRAVVGGDGSVERVTIDPSVLDDSEMLGDLVVAAVNQALAALNEEASAGLGEIGGLDLNGLLG